MCTLGVALGGFDYFFITFLGFGYLASIGFKELYSKNDYLFYANNGVSKLQLLIFSYLLTICAAVIMGLMVFLFKKVL